MNTFTDRIYVFNDAYEFNPVPDIKLGDYLSQELIYQLQNLEELWVKLDRQKGFGSHDFSQEIDYQRRQERFHFRLEELKRFLSKIKGPRIILYVCSEIADFLKEQQLLKHALTQENVKQIEHILVVMNSFFQPEIARLNLMTQDEVTHQLKTSMEKLLSRYSEKNREESLKPLSNKQNPAGKRNQPKVPDGV